MADNEIELHADVRAPAIAGFGGSAGIRYKRTWEDRDRELVDQISEQSGLSLSELEQRVADDEILGDVFWDARNRAVRVGDEQYRTVVARLVAAACDTAKVDVAALVLSEITKLEPIQLRLLLVGFEFRDNEGRVIDAATAVKGDAATARPAAHQRENLMGALRLRTDTYDVVLRPLMNADLFSQLEGPAGSATPKMGQGPTPWACTILELLFPEVHVEREPSFDLV